MTGVNITGDRVFRILSGTYCFMCHHNNVWLSQFKEIHKKERKERGEGRGEKGEIMNIPEKV